MRFHHGNPHTQILGYIVRLRLKTMYVVICWDNLGIILAEN